MIFSTNKIFNSWISNALEISAIFQQRKSQKRSSINWPILISIQKGESVKMIIQYKHSFQSLVESVNFRGYIKYSVVC